MITEIEPFGALTSFTTDLMNSNLRKNLRLWHFQWKQKSSWVLSFPKVYYSTVGRGKKHVRSVARRLSKENRAEQSKAAMNVGDNGNRENSRW